MEMKNTQPRGPEDADGSGLLESDQRFGPAGTSEWGVVPWLLALALGLIGLAALGFELPGIGWLHGLGTTLFGTLGTMALITALCAALVEPERLERSIWAAAAGLALLVLLAVPLTRPVIIGATMAPLRGVEQIVEDRAAHYRDVLTNNG